MKSSGKLLRFIEAVSYSSAKPSVEATESRTKTTSAEVRQRMKEVFGELISIGETQQLLLLPYL